VIKCVTSAVAFILNAIVWYIFVAINIPKGQLAGYWITGVLIVFQSPTNGSLLTSEEVVFQNYSVLMLLTLFAYYLSINNF